MFVRKCRVCGCSKYDPCVDEATGETLNPNIEYCAVCGCRGGHRMNCPAWQMIAGTVEPHLVARQYKFENSFAAKKCFEVALTTLLAYEEATGAHSGRCHVDNEFLTVAHHAALMRVFDALADIMGGVIFAPKVKAAKVIGVAGVAWDAIGHGWRVECTCGYRTDPSPLLQYAAEEVDAHCMNEAGTEEELVEEQEEHEK